MTVRAAVDYVEATVPGVTKYHDPGTGHVQLRDRLADRQLFQRGGRFGDDNGIEFVRILAALVFGSCDHVAWRVDFGRELAWHTIRARDLAALKPAVVTPQALFDAN